MRDLTSGMVWKTISRLLLMSASFFLFPEEPPNDDITECTTDRHVILLEHKFVQYNGKYSCRANLEGYGWTQQSDSLTLDVHYMPGPARVSIYPMVAKKNKRLTITCSAISNPPPHKYRWYRGEKEILHINSSQYVIEHLRMEDADTYTCSAENIIGIGESGSHYVDIYAEPKFINKMDILTVIPYLSDETSLVCAVECSPMCSIVWKRNGVDIDKDDPSFVQMYDFLDPVNNFHESIFTSLVSSPSLL